MRAYDNGIAFRYTVPKQPGVSAGSGAEFIQTVPSAWDETRVLAGDIGQFIVSARRIGDTWYIGAMTRF
jgi:alpha-glucosidase